MAVFSTLRPSDSFSSKGVECRNISTKDGSLKLRSSAASRTPSPPPVHERQEVAETLSTGASTPPAVPRAIYPRPVRSKVPAAVAARGIPNQGVQATAQAPLGFDTQLPPGFYPPPGLPAPPGLQLPQAAGAQVMRPPKLQSFAPTIGSIGHPHNCGRACRYVKRKGGCRDGDACTSCHLCFWHRAGEKQETSQDEELNLVADFTSVGTKGHPEHCGAPCKYFRRKGGCRDGADCPNCHICQWRREKPAEVLEEQEESSAQTPTPAFFGDSGENLRGLIASLLSSQGETVG